MNEMEREREARRIVIARRRAQFEAEVLQEMTNLQARENLAAISNKLSEYDQRQHREVRDQVA